MANIKSETHRLSEDTDILKENYTQFTSKLDYHTKKISSFNTSYHEHLENISSNNTVIRKVKE